MNKENLKKYQSELVLIVITVFWGATFVIVKKSLFDSSPSLFLAIRFSLATLLLLPIYFKRRQFLDKKFFLAALGLGFLFWIGMFFQTIGLELTTATKSGFFTSTGVLFIPIFQIFIEKKRPTNGAIIGIVLVIIGILFLSSGGNSIFTFLEDISTNFNLGDFFTLLSAPAFALYIVYLDILSKKHDLWMLVFLQIASVAFFSILTTIMFGTTGFEPIKLNITSNLIVSILYVSIIATIMNTILMTKFQKGVTPAKAGIIYSFEPVFAAIVAYYVLNEIISSFGLIGSIFIFFGLIISETFDSINEKWKQKKLEQKL